MTKTEHTRTQRFRKKPVVIKAQQWLGGDYGWLETFCGRNWSRADAVDMPDFETGPKGENVVVYNSLERQWLNVPVGHWIIRGLKGELYPCEPGVFAATYEPVEPRPKADAAVGEGGE